MYVTIPRKFADAIPAESIPPKKKMETQMTMKGDLPMKNSKNFPILVKYTTVVRYS